MPVARPALPRPCLTAALPVVWLAARADADVGPGAGRAGVGSAGTALLLLLGLATAAALPFYGLWSWARARRRRARASRVVVIGLDGLDPELCERWMAEGRLPHLQGLAAAGAYRRLGTTLPAMTPAAWSTFSTGVDPSRHGIFDFVGRDPRTYQPLLSSVAIEAVDGRPRVRGRRRSQPFWKHLGRAGVPCTILRLPITFPPEPFDGLLLSGMCVPDLRGTQGECTWFTAAPRRGEPATGGAVPPAIAAAHGTGHRGRGRVVQLELVDGEARASLPGPPAPGPGEPALELSVRLVVRGRGAELTVGDHHLHLEPGTYTPWTRLTFGSGRGRVRGLCRFRLASTDPLAVYATPLQLDPAGPAMPVSHPAAFAGYLERRLGPYATLGLAEDTDALDEGFLDEGAFLAQAWDLHAEREAMLFHALERDAGGLTACVFDGPDRIQHMFWRTLDPSHPANAGRPVGEHQEVIADLYARMDDLVGRALAAVAGDPGAVVLVVSDHGFGNFRRTVDLNAWLHQNGYLHLEPGAAAGPWMAGVDWSRTRAYALGLTGLYLNLRGREAAGIVAPEEAGALKAELARGLTGLRDPDTGQVAIRRAWDMDERFDGPYRDAGPDLLPAYSRGYRVSWTSARGEVGEAVFADNARPWSGDHCVDPDLVPGVLFSSRPFALAKPHLADLAPSILGLFGVQAPPYMRGRDLWATAAGSGGPP
ncbi:MAG: alkaline phosphatase family protein [Gemmatimonadota bacterium]